MNAVSFNGEPVRADLALSRALHYGDGVFRTLLMQNGVPLDFQRQHSRLAEDARRLGLEAPDAELLDAELRAGDMPEGLSVAKIILSRRAEGRGYAPATSVADRWVLHSALPDAPTEYWQQGVRLIRSNVTLAAQPLLAGIKHLNRLEQVLASRDWPADVQEALMCDAQGAPVCGTRTNLFWIKNQRLMTPALRDCGVCGMMRQKILEQAMALEIPCDEDRYGWKNLLAADEIFISNSLIGIWPVRELESVGFAAPGPQTQRLMQTLQHPWQGGR